MRFFFRTQLQHFKTHSQQCLKLAGFDLKCSGRVHRSSCSAAAAGSREVLCG